MLKPDGPAATEAILSSGPAVRVLLLTPFDSDEYVHRALAAGASGLLLESLPPKELIAAARGWRRVRPAARLTGGR
ncbi:response regulator transcription factor [Cryptosporangium phraense]|uniref:Response regulator transcription factor n=2 Tax=Cryptosporangium phraense TaxID=2593070 RepID=A0A545AVW1_9ACTN|nr:response regulator transcription factor [Cryptosporangium phraense]